MSSSPDRQVIRGAVADNATAARFAVDLRKPDTLDSEGAEHIKKQARTTGYAEGWAQGKRDATDAAEAAKARALANEEAYEHRRTTALAQAVNALGRAVTELENQLMPTFTELQEIVLATAFELAEAIVGRTLHDHPERGAAALRRAMSAAPEQGEMVVRLHPDDHQTLTGSDAGDDFDYQGRRITLRPDPSLQPGDAVAETGTATVDATIAAALSRAREALRV